VNPSVTPDAFAFRAKLPWLLWVLYRCVRVPIVASAFAGFWLFGTMLAWIVLPIAAFGGRDPSERVARCQRVLAWSFRGFHGYMRLMRLVDARVAALPARDAFAAGGARGRVLVANHTTLVDMTAILASYPRVCCVAKPEMAKSPFVGRLLRACGFITSGRDLLERGASLDECVRWIDLGFDVLVFPEGTRSPPGSLHPFQRGAFEIARRANAAVIPLVLTCRPSALSKGRPFWLHPDECAILEVVPQAPISPESWSNSRTLRADVETMYREWLGLNAPLE